MIGLGLGKLVARLDNGDRIVMEDVKDMTFVSGITKLVYIVLFNLFKSYNVEDNDGSDFIEIIKNMALFMSQPEKSEVLITNELENVKNRIKSAQKKYMEDYGFKIPDSELLRSVNILLITPDIINTEIIIDFEIINEEGTKCYVTT